MKRFIVLLLIFISQSTSAQFITKSTKIILRYAKGHDPFSDEGVYSRDELFEIGHNGKSFRLLKYLTIKDIAGQDSLPNKHDTTVMNVSNYRPIQKKELDSLICKLSVNKSNFNYRDIRPRLKAPSAKQSKAIAAKLDSADSDKDNRYSEDAADNMQNILHFDKLEKFIAQRTPNIDLVVVTSDVWDTLRITVINDGEKTIFNGDFLQLLGQPFTKTERGNFKSRKRFINIEINEALAALLPKSSALRKAVDIQNLTGRYIEWYLTKRE